ncbi:hypothetical protein F0562_013617 [Nyssa sinensis]|uniref:Uncharacterized protein n=1 Tax=Nyssa sinensis TaxID=561372 RepID=A0A5J4ZQL1_9ASTE|nr:hypothetical protein F0562_013617 [Nyssa sinensis]
MFNFLIRPKRYRTLRYFEGTVGGASVILAIEYQFGVFSSASLTCGSSFSSRKSSALISSDGSCGGFRVGRDGGQHSHPGGGHGRGGRDSGCGKHGGRGGWVGRAISGNIRS